MQKDLDGNVCTNVSTPWNSQSHQGLSTASPQILENILQVRGAIGIRSQRLLPWCRVVLGCCGALCSPAGSQRLREQLACSFLPVKVEPQAFVLDLPLSSTLGRALPALGLGRAFPPPLHPPQPSTNLQPAPLCSPPRGQFLRGTLGSPPRPAPPPLCIQWECSAFDPLFLWGFPCGMKAE